MTAPAHERPSGVSSIELFFDLVFVFVITQITHLVEHAHGAMDFFRALLVLVPIWWMYAGYAWLTNIAGESVRMRLVLIAAMAGFLVMAIVIPSVFGAGALTFGLTYLFIVALHLGAFALESVPARAILGIAPFNLGASALLIGAAIAASLGGIGAHWGAFASLAAIAAVAIAVIAVERRLEPA
jgi:low temperature requirement protein LtrA